MNPGEVIILHTDDCVNYTRGRIHSYNGDLKLTTEAVICAKKNFVGKLVNEERYELSEIQMHNGQPAVKIEKEVNDNLLVIYMTDGRIGKFRIGQGMFKQGTQKWVDAITKQITGQEGSKEDYVLPGVKGIANYASGTIGAIKASFGIKNDEPVKITKICPACGGQMTGFVGKTCECPYCGTITQI